MDIGQRDVSVVGVVILAETKLRKSQQESRPVARGDSAFTAGHSVGSALMISLLRVHIP